MTPKTMSPERLEEIRNNYGVWGANGATVTLYTAVDDLLADRAALTAPVDDLEVQNALRNMAEACCCEPNKTCVPCKTADLLTRLSAECERLKAERDVYEAALRFISDESIPDQPASSPLSELEWAVNSYRELRKVAWDVIDGKFHTYQSPRSEPEIKVRGVGRDLFEPRSASVALTERPTNEELISLHEYLRGWKP